MLVFGQILDNGQSGSKANYLYQQGEHSHRGANRTRAGKVFTSSSLKMVFDFCCLYKPIFQADH